MGFHTLHKAIGQWEGIFDRFQVLCAIVMGVSSSISHHTELFDVVFAVHPLVFSSTKLDSLLSQLTC